MTFNSGKLDRTRAGAIWQRENHLYLEVSASKENPFSTWKMRYKSVPREISIALDPRFSRSWLMAEDPISPGWIKMKDQTLNLIYYLPGNM